MLLNNWWITENDHRRNQKNTWRQIKMKTQQSQISKTLVRGKFIAMQAYLRTQEKSHINNLTLYLKELENKEQRKSKVSRRKEIIKIKAEINEIEAKKKKIKMINETKSWFFETINKTDKPLTRLIKKKKRQGPYQ